VFPTPLPGVNQQGETLEQSVVKLIPIVGVDQIMSKASRDYPVQRGKATCRVDAASSYPVHGVSSPVPHLHEKVLFAFVSQTVELPKPSCKLILVGKQPARVLAKDGL
jgi:hypothetical protein